MSQAVIPRGGRVPELVQTAMADSGQARRTRGRKGSRRGPSAGGAGPGAGGPPTGFGSAIRSRERTWVPGGQGKTRGNLPADCDFPCGTGGDGGVSRMAREPWGGSALPGPHGRRRDPGRHWSLECGFGSTGRQMPCGQGLSPAVPACDVPSPAHAWPARMTGGRQEGDGTRLHFQVPSGLQGKALPSPPSGAGSHHPGRRGGSTPCGATSKSCSAAETCPAWAGCFGGSEHPTRRLRELRPLRAPRGPGPHAAALTAVAPAAWGCPHSRRLCCVYEPMRKTNPSPRRE